MGRPNKYFENVEPRLSEVEKMALIMTDKEIAAALCVGYSNFKAYKAKYKALADALKKGREVLVVELKNTLIKKAKGYDYEEVKTIEELDEEGNLVITRKETYKKHCQPDVAAINLMLKNYDRDFWRNDPAEYELKKRAVELQEKKVELSEW